MLIELIREGRVEEAVVYAQDHLAERGQRDPTILNELERTLALLAFDQPDTSPFGDLLHPSHRQKVSYLFFFLMVICTYLELGTEGLHNFFLYLPLVMERFRNLNDAFMSNSIEIYFLLCYTFFFFFFFF